jgi:hypothetical protein
VLVYELQPDGTLRLVALEYVVLQEGWDASHASAPSLFGQDFMLTPAGNRYGLPAFYALHAWIWKANPSGMFSPYNPSVGCGAPLGVEAAASAAGGGVAAHPMAYACPLADDRRWGDAGQGNVPTPGARWDVGGLAPLDPAHLTRSSF